MSAWQTEKRRNVSESPWQKEEGEFLRGRQKEKGGTIP